MRSLLETCGLIAFLISNAHVLIYFVCVCVCVFQNAGAGGTEGVHVALAGDFDPSVSLGSSV